MSHFKTFPVLFALIRINFIENAEIRIQTQLSKHRFTSTFISFMPLAVSLHCTNQNNLLLILRWLTTLLYISRERYCQLKSKLLERRLDVQPPWTHFETYFQPSKFYSPNASSVLGKVIPILRQAFSNTTFPPAYFYFPFLFHSHKWAINS